MASQPHSHATKTLPRVLGPFDALTVVVGSIIGSGIFLKPNVAARELGSFGLILSVWIGVGLITLCGSLTLAELAAMLPHAGGPYVYLREAYGRLAAFLWGWTEFWVVRTGAVGALACATAIYLSELRPLTRNEQEAVAVAIVVGLSAINIFSTRWGALVQNATATIKVAFLGFIIVLPFAVGGAESANLKPLWPDHYQTDIWAGLAGAVVAVMWAYDGWINLAPVAEEIRNPQRNVPLALGLGLLLVIGLYVSANLAYHLVLPMADVANSDAVASTMCQKLLGSSGGKLVALGVMCSTFGAVNSNLLCGPRIYFAMSRDGLLPQAVHKIHAHWQTPINAILLQGAWTVLLIVAAYAWKDLPADAFNALTDFVIFGGSIFYALAVASVFVLRRKQPLLARPFRTWGYPYVPALYLLAFGAALASLLIYKWRESLAGSVVILVGVAFFFWMRVRASRASGSRAR